MYSFLKAFLVLMKLLSLSQFYAPKIKRFLNKQKLRRTIYIILIINMFFIQELVNNNLFKNNHIIILWNSGFQPGGRLPFFWGRESF